MENKFNTSRGVMVEFVGIAPLLDALRAQYQPPKPPTYVVKTAAGAEEIHTHYRRVVKRKELDDAGNEIEREIEETSLETDAERVAWAEYERELAETEAKANQALVRLVLLRGIKIAMPQDDEWVKDHEFMGLRVPADPRARRLYYLENEVVGNQRDVERIVEGVLLASGVNEGMVSAMEAAFRGHDERNAAAGPAETNSSSGQALEREQPL